MNTFTITMRNGTVLDVLKKNASTFVSQTEIQEETLAEENLVGVVITEHTTGGKDVSVTMTNPVCDTVYYMDGEGWMFNIREKTEMELRKKENEMLTECILEMSEIIYGE